MMNKRYIAVVISIIIFCVCVPVIIVKISCHLKNDLRREETIAEKKDSLKEKESSNRNSSFMEGDKAPLKSDRQQQVQIERQGETEKGIAHGFESYKGATIDVAGLNREAQEFEKIGDFETAIEKYRQAIELKPDLDMTYNNLGDLYYKKGDYMLAVDNFEKALSIKKRAAYYNNLGNVYYKKREYSRAILEYEKALKLKPEAAYIYNNLGDTYLKKGSALIAAKYLKKAISLRPDFILAYKNLKEAYVSKGKYEEAEEILRIGIDNNRSELILYFELARLYEQQRRYEEELDLLKEYLIFGPYDKMVQLKIESLEQIVCR